MNRESKEYALKILNEAFKADPVLVNAVFSENNRVACSHELANHETIVCRPGPAYPTVGMMGFINGLLCQPGDTLKIWRDFDNKTGELVGFRLAEGAE